MSLKNQRRLAAEILKIGENRIFIDPERISEVEAAITREEIKKLIREKVIRSHSKKGVSRTRARAFHEKQKKGLRSGPGRKSGPATATTSKKQAWMKRIRVLRKNLRELKERNVITKSVYRELYNKAGAGMFKSKAELERYIKLRGLSRNR